MLKRPFDIIDLERVNGKSQITTHQIGLLKCLKCERMIWRDVVACKNTYLMVTRSRILIQLINAISFSLYIGSFVAIHHNSVSLVACVASFKFLVCIAERVSFATIILPMTEYKIQKEKKIDNNIMQRISHTHRPQFTVALLKLTVHQTIWSIDTRPCVDIYDTSALLNITQKNGK